MNIPFFITVGVLLAFVVRPAMAQSDLDKAKNLASCLDGRYPALCKRAWLTPQERQKVEVAEHRENLKTCLSGRYTALCKKDKLSPEELKQVLLAERRENLKTCMNGRYKALCKKSLLTELELKHVLAAEAAENLKTCLSGRFLSLCDRSLLTPQQLTQTQAAEKINAVARPPSARRPAARFAGRGGYSSGCEDGHWVESVSSDGSIVKLEDGSVWEVDAGDTVDSALWLPVSDIIACDDKLINADDDESVSARKIR